MRDGCSRRSGGASVGATVANAVALAAGVTGGVIGWQDTRAASSSAVASSLRGIIDPQRQFQLCVLFLGRWQLRPALDDVQRRVKCEPEFADTVALAIVHSSEAAYHETVDDAHAVNGQPPQFDPRAVYFQARLADGRHVLERKVFGVIVVIVRDDVGE